MTEQDITSKTKAWKAIFDKYNIYNHDFSLPYFISATNIKSATKHFDKTAEKEVRIICKQDTRESRPDIFKELGLFFLIYKVYMLIAPPPQSSIAPPQNTIAQ